MFPDADGIFMDISFQLPSISSSAKTKMDAMGLDWMNPADRDTFTNHSVENYFTRVRDAVRKHDPKMPLFFNSGHVRRGLRKHYADFYSHLEIESLPTAGWGYEHFPLSARYLDPLGIPFLGHDRQVSHPLGRGRWLQASAGADLRSRRHAGAGRARLDRRPSASERAARRLDTQAGRAGLQVRGGPRALGRRHAPIGPTSRCSPSRPPRGPSSSASLSTTRAPTKAASACCSRRNTPSTWSISTRTSRNYRLVILPDAIHVDAALKAKLEAYVAARRQGAAHRHERHRSRSRLRARRGWHLEGHLAEYPGRLPAADPGAAGQLRAGSAVHVPAGGAGAGHRRRGARRRVRTLLRSQPAALHGPPACAGEARSLRDTRPACERAATPTSASRSSPATTRMVPSR